MFGNELAEDLVLTPVLLLAVPAAVTEAQAAAASLQPLPFPACDS